jgi:predicted enzyme related to lactoylglutathione lyase
MAVTGIGGLFFRSRDPAALKKWYQEVLGIPAPGSWFFEQQAGQTVFEPFKADTDYFPADRQWMLNLRVDDLDGLLASLAARSIAIITNPEWDHPDTGRFARIHDPEGNPIELWQPPEG